MRIKTIKEPPIDKSLRPEIGSEHDVIDSCKSKRGNKVYFVMFRDVKIGILDSECEVLK